MKDLVLKPRISEKAYGLSQNPEVKTYVFDVPLDANKHSVARAVSAQYEVTVTAVRTIVQNGKTKMTYRKGQRPLEGKRSDVKKAYVTLKAGDTLPLFVEEAAEEAKAAKEAERADKKAKKETK